MSVYANNRLVKDNPNDAWSKIFQFIEPKTTVLDIGCSSGKLGQALKKEKEVHVTGIDIDADDVRLAKKNLDAAYVVNIEKEDLAKYGTFDYVIMSDVVEHLVDPVAVLKKVKQLLKKDGKFVFSIPNMANVTTRIELLKGQFTYKDFGLLDRTHLHFYDTTEVNRVFNESGFVIRSMDCTLRPIPEKLLKKELEGIGISLTPKLHQILTKPDAAIYQFIGVATPGKTPHKMAPETTIQLDIISVEMERMRNDFDKQLKERDEILGRLDGEKRRLQHELDLIHGSKSWKLLTKAQNVKKRIAPPKDKK